MNAAEGFQPNMNRPVDPAESEVTQWLNPRKRNDPWPMWSGVISICGKRICGDAWSRPPCQRGQQINCPGNLFAGDSRQSVTISPEPAANSYWVLRIPPTRWRGPPPFDKGGVCKPGQQKTGPEKSDPTQLSYHSSGFKSTPKWSAGEKICVLHKSDCLHLGNIPSWKVRIPVLSYSHKEEPEKHRILWWTTKSKWEIW